MDTGDPRCAGHDGRATGESPARATPDRGRPGEVRGIGLDPAIPRAPRRPAAAALDCTLVYALVPNNSLEGAVAARARRIALRDLERVAHTMKLEAQETDDAGKEERIEDYIRSLGDRRLWDEP
jgi:hypothetical protein